MNSPQPERPQPAHRALILLLANLKESHPEKTAEASGLMVEIDAYFSQLYRDIAAAATGNPVTEIPGPGEREPVAEEPHGPKKRK